MTVSARRPLVAVLLLSLAGALAASCNIDISNQAEAKDEWKKSYPYTPGEVLDIRNTNGSIDVQPSTGATIEIVAERIAHGGSDQAAKDALQALEIHETVTSGGVTLDSTSHTSGWHFGSYEVRYHVKAPRALTLKLQGTNAEITVVDMTGAFEAHTTNGSIHASGLANAATADSTNGDVELDVASLADDGVSCQTTNGDVTVTVPHDARARLNLTVTNGSINTDNLSLATSESSSRRLSATIGGGGPLVRIGTTNGDIHVKGR